MYKPETNPWLIEVKVNGAWLKVGSSKTMETAEKRAESAKKNIRADEWRITYRGKQG